MSELDEMIAENEDPEVEAAEAAESENEGNVVNELDDGRIISLLEFDKDSAKKGFSFHQKTWKDVASALNDIGEDKVLDMINIAASQAQRQKAGNSLPTFEDKGKQAEEWDKKRAAGDTILLSEQAATTWEPGTRELGVVTATARYNTAVIAFKKAKADPETTEEELARLAAKGKDAKKVMDDAQAKFDAETADVFELA